jgi:hypothetical protein
MELYLNKNPDVAKHIAANVTLFDEEKIEFLNAKIGRWFNPRTPNCSIDDYTRVTFILKGAEDARARRVPAAARAPGQGERSPPRLVPAPCLESWASSRPRSRKRCRVGLLATGSARGWEGSR